MVSAIKREERIGGQRLLLGDCLEVMKELGRFDAVVTDPPYGIGYDGNNASTGGHGGRKAHVKKDWDSCRPDNAVFDLMRSISDNQIIWGGNYFADLLPPTMRWLVWDKGQRIDQSDGELAWTSYQKALRICTINRVELMKDGTQHPTQKPLKLMEWTLGFTEGTIIDPFAGSGTVALACQRSGRQSTSIELDPEYFDIACKRVDEASRQPDMFVSAPEPKPIQEGLC